MRKKIEWQPEILNEFGDQTVGYTCFSRIKVIGGWLVHHTFQRKSVISESMEFVADKDHEWTIVVPAKEERPPESNPVSAGF